MSLNHFRLICWDFDGVIKDSVDVKTEAFVELFQEYGQDIAEKVRAHHLANCGMSRFEKLPLYCRWSGREADCKDIENLCERFSSLALQRVIDSPWVSGVERLLRNNPYNQKFALVSATPQEEIDRIVKMLDLTECFVDVFGAPVPKRIAIRKSLDKCAINPEHCLMIGDARADLEAAEDNEVAFLLRLHAANLHVFDGYEGMVIEDFSNL